VEFRDVVRRRKMVRTYHSQPVSPDVVDRILSNARRAPSAGFSQGVAFLILQGPHETGRFWQAVAVRGDGEWPNEGLRRAPVVVVPLASKKVYLDRYAEEDKGWADRDEARWPVPYWIVDAAFASMSILLSAVDEGLGALFFGLEAAGYEGFRRAFGVPTEWEPIGAIAIGHAATTDPVPSSRDTKPRKKAAEVIHRGRW
jgi:nitroreductase